MRLIDADRLIDFIDVGHHRHPDELSYSEIDLVNMVNSVPTAYEVDSIVDRLEKYLFEKYCVENDSEIEKIMRGDR